MEATRKEGIGKGKEVLIGTNEGKILMLPWHSFVYWAYPRAVACSVDRDGLDKVGSSVLESLADCRQ